MRILELFSGTGSKGKAFAEQGWEVISLDSDPKTDATIHADILTWDHTLSLPAQEGKTGCNPP
jgi:hypothetical protein